jgi:hypothetical protein
MVAAVRKEVRGVAVCAPAHIVDGVVRDTGVSELKSNQRGKITVQLCSIAPNDVEAIRGPLQLSSNLFSDLEGIDTNVRTDRNDELSRIVCKCPDGTRNDASHCAPPTRMHGTDVSARGMRDQNRHAIGRTRGHCKSFCAGNEGVTLGVRNRFGRIGRRYLPDMGPVHLPLLEETIARKIEALGKARTVRANRVVVIAQMKTKVECVVGCSAHAA